MIYSGQTFSQSNYSEWLAKAPLILETDLVVNLASVYSRPCALASINLKPNLIFNRTSFWLILNIEQVFDAVAGDQAFASHLESYFGWKEVQKVIVCYYDVSVKILLSSVCL